MKINHIRTFSKEQSGSAIIEFIVYALPLFVPLVIYLTSVNQTSQIQYEARNFARQLARAYVTSPSQNFAEFRISAVTTVFAKSSFPQNRIDPNPIIEISCTLYPCMSPNGKVIVKVLLKSITTGQSASATAVQTVDSWRNS
jgi:Flp pilus assembly protein TadG